MVCQGQCDVCGCGCGCGRVNVNMYVYLYSSARAYTCVCVCVVLYFGKNVRGLHLASPSGHTHTHTHAHKHTQTHTHTHTHTRTPFRSCSKVSKYWLYSRENLNRALNFQNLFPPPSFSSGRWFRLASLWLLSFWHRACFRCNRRTVLTSSTPCVRASLPRVFVCIVSAQ